jgi:hypothetical protein
MRLSPLPFPNFPGKWVGNYWVAITIDYSVGVQLFWETDHLDVSFKGQSRETYKRTAPFMIIPGNFSYNFDLVFFRY